MASRQGGNVFLMFFEENDLPHPGPFFYQPDPEKPFFVPAKAEKLVSRGPREYFLVGRTPDGNEVEARLTSVTFWGGRC